MYASKFELNQFDKRKTGKSGLNEMHSKRQAQKLAEKGLASVMEHQQVKKKSWKFRAFSQHNGFLS